MLGVLPRVIPKVKQTIPSNFVLSFKTIPKDSKKIVRVIKQKF